MKVSLDVSNIGARAGEEVVQLYISPNGSAVERAPKELKAFTRIALQPGETKTAQISVPVSRLAYNKDLLDLLANAMPGRGIITP